MDLFWNLIEINLRRSAQTITAQCLGYNSKQTIFNMDSKDKEFLIWLSNRLIFKHGYNEQDDIVRKLLSLGTQSSEIKINNNDMDLIISKYYVDFFLEKSEDAQIGYTEHERENIRKYAKSLVSDIINHNIPSTSIIK